MFREWEGEDGQIISLEKSRKDGETELLDIGINIAAKKGSFG